MPARLKVLNVFHITGRGRVVAGDILEGTVRVGMLAFPQSARDQRWRISSVEFADKPGGEGHIALVLPDAPAVETLRATLPRGTVLEIEDAASS